MDERWRPSLQLRTRLLRLLVRTSLARRRGWAERGYFRPFAFLLQRGQVAIEHGRGSGLLLLARAIAPAGAQSFGVLAGVHEVQVQEAICRTAGPGDVVWDVGANIGFMSLIAAAAVGPEGHVLAIEPNPTCVALIRGNATLNGMPQLEALSGAAASRSGTAELVLVADSLWTRLALVGDHELSTGRATVAAFALDDLKRRPPDVIKIDVEGAELEVLEGMQQLLRAKRPIVICEMHGKNAAFCDAMEALGYRVRNLDDPGPVRHAHGNVHALCEPDDAHRDADGR